MSDLIYKIIGSEEWRAAEEAGVFRGSGIDLTDGYIHFSTANQAAETAAKHFADRDDLLLVAVAPGPLGDAIKFEKSRNDELFPHLYGALDLESVIAVHELPLADDGTHLFPFEPLP